MGDSKIIKKFRRLLEDSEEEHVFQGTITEFINVDYVPKNRYISGILVDGIKKPCKVEFGNGQKKYIQNVSSLEIGDEILILGKKNESKPNTTQPTIMLLPGKRLVLLSREPMRYRSEGLTENSQIVSIILAVLLACISWLSNDVPFILTGTMYMFWEITFWSCLGSLSFFILFVLILLYDHNIRRERVIQCDSTTWKIMSEEIIEQFGTNVNPT